MGILAKGLEGSLRSLATVFNVDGNSTNETATQEVYEALVADEDLVADIQFNSGVLDVIAGDPKPQAIVEKARDVLATVQAHKDRLGYRVPART